MLVAILVPALDFYKLYVLITDSLHCQVPQREVTEGYHNNVVMEIHDL